MEKKRLVLFDIDGTLLNGGRLFRECVVRAFSSFHPGVDVPKTSLSGKTDRLIFKEFLVASGLEAGALEGDGAGHALIQSMIDRYLEILSAEVSAGNTGEVRILPGVRAALSALAADPRITLGLLTGNIRGGAKIKLGLIDVDSYFDAGHGGFGDDHWNRFELPQLAVSRVEKESGMAFRGKEVVIIGDTAHDVNCGKSIGVRSIAVGTGRAEMRAELLAANPDYFLEDLRETDALLGMIWD